MFLLPPHTHQLMTMQESSIPQGLLDMRVMVPILPHCSIIWCQMFLTQNLPSPNKARKPRLINAFPIWPLIYPLYQKSGRKGVHRWIYYPRAFAGSEKITDFVGIRTRLTDCAFRSDNRYTIRISNSLSLYIYVYIHKLKWIGSQRNLNLVF